MFSVGSLHTHTCIGGEAEVINSHFDILSPSFPFFLHHLLKVDCVPGPGLGSGGQQRRKLWCLISNTFQFRERLKEIMATWSEVWAAGEDLVARTSLRPLPAELLNMVKNKQSICALMDELTGSTLAFLHLCRVEMSAPRLISNRTSQQSTSNSDYTWEYEYYEIGPVSFEGLKAHKCKFYTILQCKHNMHLS